MLDTSTDPPSSLLLQLAPSPPWAAPSQRSLRCSARTHLLGQLLHKAVCVAQHVFVELLELLGEYELCTRPGCDVGGGGFLRVLECKKSFMLLYISFYNTSFVSYTHMQHINFRVHTLNTVNTAKWLKTPHPIPAACSRPPQRPSSIQPRAACWRTRWTRVRARHRGMRTLLGAPPPAQRCACSSTPADQNRSSRCCCPVSFPSNIDLLF